MAVYKKSPVALTIEKYPVVTAATAYLKPISPEASLIKLSPLTKCKIFESNFACLAIDCTATGSVGDKIAAKAKATYSGISGTNK